MQEEVRNLFCSVHGQYNPIHELVLVSSGRMNILASLGSMNIQTGIYAYIQRDITCESF